MANYPSYTCGAPWKTCTCTEEDQREKERKIQERFEKHEAEARVEEEEIRAAIAAVEAAERLVSEEREAERELLTVEARQTTGREYERLEGITEFFEHLRDRLEKVRLQQKRAIEQRQRMELQKVEEKEAALVCGGKILDRDQKVATKRAELVKNNEDVLRDLRKTHARQLMETVGRHRKDQDAYIAKPSREMETNENVDQAGVLEMLLQAQEVERTTLRSQQTREIQKWEKRGPRLLEAFDAQTEAERLKIVEAQVEEAEELTSLAAAAKQRISADWKWFDAIFLDRTMMLGGDERRMILSGSDAPKPPYNTTLN